MPAVVETKTVLRPDVPSSQDSEVRIASVFTYFYDGLRNGLPYYAVYGSGRKIGKVWATTPVSCFGKWFTESGRGPYDTMNEAAECLQEEAIIRAMEDPKNVRL